MNQEFESLPFELEGEMEAERGMRPPGRGMGTSRGRAPARPPGTKPTLGRARPAGPGRPGPYGRGYLRGPRWPYYGPVYGGWPYGVVLREPYADPYAGPDTGADAGQDGTQEPPFPDDADGMDMTSPEHGETPPTLVATLGRLPAAQRPAYLALGALTGALRDARATGPGFYLIEFTVNGRQRAYSGQTNNLRRRLQQHALCGQMMGLPLTAHQVYVAPSSLSDAQRRAVESRIHDDMFRNQAGVLTNQRRELEVQLFGSGWE
ncbi:MAG: hypothetical protein V4724_00370 [Pseudomonadota bacterium]